MQHELDSFISETKEAWSFVEIHSFLKIQLLLESFGKKEVVKKSLQESSGNLLKGQELYRDSEYGFVLTAYSEQIDTYRIPHNHGNGWVVYAVVDGIMEMGNYIHLPRPSDFPELILKNSNTLRAGDCNIYYPGEIHHTRCISENVIILRLTSCDLKEEEKQGRMKRFNL